MIYCPKCSHGNSEDSNYCVKCGECLITEQFYFKYGDVSTKACDVFIKIRVAADEAKSIDEKIDLLQKAIEAYQIAKDWHYNHSEGAMLWFQDMWEHCHNSRSDCFCWVDRVNAYRNQLIEERDVIIPWILNAAQEGFLQTEIYTVFPEAEKSDLQRIVKMLADDGKINRTKKGKTYFVFSNV